MSGLAEILLRLGHHVSGSDSSDSEILSRLEQLGARVFKGHAEENIRNEKPDVVVFSSAIGPDNPEIVAAEKNEVPLIRRAEMLAELMRLKRGLAIAGSHGKTTTTGMLSVILKGAGFDPTVVIGGKLDALGSTNAALGAGAWMVAEADESDGSFLRLSPEIAVVTNIDKEHLDHFKNVDACVAAFAEFLDRLPFYGRAILCADCPRLRSVSKALRKPKVFYGIEEVNQPDFLIRIFSEGEKSEVGIFTKKSGYKTLLGKLELRIPGRHNILNATASLLAALELDIPFSVVADALKEFSGVRRRFEFRGKFNGNIEVIEDYAHHPTEIAATLQAAHSRYNSGKIWVAFQPHRYSRTRDSWEEFKECFSSEKNVWTLPIYPASERKEEWAEKFDGENFAKHVGAEFVQNKKALIEKLRAKISKIENSEKPAALLILGAGDISKTIPDLINS